MKKIKKSLLLASLLLAPFPGWGGGLDRGNAEPYTRKRMEIPRNREKDSLLYQRLADYFKQSQRHSLTMLLPRGGDALKSLGRCYRRSEKSYRGTLTIKQHQTLYPDDGPLFYEENIAFSFVLTFADKKIFPPLQTITDSTIELGFNLLDNAHLYLRVIESPEGSIYWIAEKNRYITWEIQNGNYFRTLSNHPDYCYFWRRPSALL